MSTITAQAIDNSGPPAEKAMQRLVPKIIFYRADAFRQQLSNWSRNKLQRALAMIYEAEKDCKTTGLPAEEIVSLTLLRLAAAAKRPG